MSDKKHAEASRGEAIRPRKEANLRTRVERVAHGAFHQRLQPAPQGVFALAHYERALRDAHAQRVHNHTFVAMVDGTSAVQHCTLGPGEVTVFGRHSMASLRHRAEDISLRHLAVLACKQSTDASPRLRVWDLHTGRGFVTEHGDKAEALSGDGPLFVVVGAILIAAIPLGSLPDTLPLETKELWKALPPRQPCPDVLASDLRDESEASGSEVDDTIDADVQDAQPALQEGTSATRVSRIKRLRPAGGLGSVIEASDVVGLLRLSTPTQMEEHPVSRQLLQRGVLIGRYGHGIVVDNEESQVSRVHLLIAEVDGDVLAIDTASSFGTHTRHRRFLRCQSLKSGEALLLANDAVQLTWNSLPR